MARYSRRPVRRSPQRKFVWDRTFGQFGAGDVGVDLLAPFGVSLVQLISVRLSCVSVATSSRARSSMMTGGAGVCGIRVDTWNTDVTDLNNQPFLQPDYDWMAWLPWNVGATGPTVPRTNITWNQYASEWAVDVKSNRKLEELNETLWLFGDQTGAGERTYFYHLSIGMKLA